MKNSKSSKTTKSKSRTKSAAKKMTASSTSRSKSSATSESSSSSSLGNLTRKTDRTSMSDQTWVVFNNSSTKSPKLFDQKLSRDTVRAVYSKLTGTGFHNTRSRRLKNY